MNDEERAIYETGAPIKKPVEKQLVTAITLENGTEYYLYSDGNLYERDNSGNLKQLDRLNPASQAVIDRIMNKLNGGKTDVVRTARSEDRSIEF